MGWVKFGWVGSNFLTAVVGWVGFNATVMGWVQQLHEMRTITRLCILYPEH